MVKIHKDDIFSYSVLACIVVANIVLTIIFHFPILDLITSIIEITYIAVLAERSMFNFPFGFIASFLYLIVSFQAKLYGEVILIIAFYFPMTIITLTAWRRSIKKNIKEKGFNTVQSKKMKTWLYFVLPIIMAGVTIGYGFFLKLLGGNNPFVDALSTAVSIVTLFLVWKQCWEQWFMWIVTYAVATILWFGVNNTLLAITYMGCILFSIKGFIEWLYYYKKEKKKIKNISSSSPPTTLT